MARVLTKDDSTGTHAMAQTTKSTTGPLKWFF